MKRKTYTTVHEKRSAQTVGLVSFLLVNAALLIAIYFWSLYALVGILPWIVNGGFIIFALIFRPQIGIGYIAGFGMIIIGTMAFGVIFVAACFTAVMIAKPFNFLLDGLGPLLMYILLPVFFFGGVYFVGRQAVNIYKKLWWPSSDDDLD